MEQGLKARLRRDAVSGGSAALASGLAGALVVPLGAACDRGPLAATGFLAVLPDGAVSLALPKTEMGQGILTAITMIVAEELGVAPTAVTLRFPRPTRPVSRPSTPARAARPRSASCGSPAAGRGQCPRALIGAAARTWKVAPAGLVLDDGAVVDPARGGRRLAYGALLAQAMRRAAADRCGAARPGGLEDHRQGHPRLDSAAKVRGKALGIDVQVPGMKIATLAQSPVFGAGWPATMRRRQRPWPVSST
jgi:isoquinoline 1-oxidoreductase beta subunit